MSRFIAFLKDVRVELSKVSWPTQAETIKYTLVVIGMGASMAVFLAALDYVFQLGLKTFIIK